jgi:hypothetical protein
LTLETLRELPTHNRDINIVMPNSVHQIHNPKAIDRSQRPQAPLAEGAGLMPGILKALADVEALRKDAAMRNALSTTAVRSWCAN